MILADDQSLISIVLLKYGQDWILRLSYPLPFGLSRLLRPRPRQKVLKVVE